MQDVADRYTRPAAPSLGDFGDVLGEREQANSSAGAAGGPASAAAGAAAVGPAGFVVKGGPWEQRAPDTASTQEFPTMPGGPRAVQPAAPTPTAAWGPRR